MLRATVQSSSFPPHVRGRLGLGTVQFGLSYGATNKGGQVQASDAERILRMAGAAGFSVIDTAADYGDSETVLGDRMGAAAFRIVTKLLVFSGAGVTNADIATATTVFHRSLERLRRGKVYGLLLHRGSDVLKPGGERIVSLLHELVREGVVEKAGVSIYSPAELDAVLQFFEPGIVQLPISLFDQRFLRSGHLARLKARGVEIHARSLFLQGLLLADPGEWPRYFAPLAQHAAIYRRWLDTHSLDALQACLGFGLAQKELDCLIIGVAGVGEFVSLLQAACCVPPVMPDSSALSLDDETFVNPSLWKLGP